MQYLLILFTLSVLSGCSLYKSEARKALEENAIQTSMALSSIQDFAACSELGTTQSIQFTKKYEFLEVENGSIVIYKFSNSQPLSFVVTDFTKTTTVVCETREPASKITDLQLEDIIEQIKSILKETNIGDLQ